MGLFRKLFGLQQLHEPAKPTAPTTPRIARSAIVSVTPRPGDLVKVAGTTTFAKNGALNTAARFASKAEGYAEIRALVEPDTARVLVDGTWIGSLPTYKAQEIAQGPGAVLTATVQVFLSETPRGDRVDVWAWLGPGQPQWEYSRSNRPPITTEQRARETQTQIDETVQEALTEGGARADNFHRGMVGGIHYLQLVEPIKQLKREGRLEEALELCDRAIEGAEKACDGREPAPWYTMQAAIIHRKLKQRDAEIAVLQRWMNHCPPERREGSEVAARLAKLTA